MTGILAEIVAHKRTELEEAKKRIPLSDLEQRITDLTAPLDFVGALKVGGCSLIAEVKTASPSRGIIRDDVDPLEVASIYEANGAACISVLTDERYFRGNLERLRKIRVISSLPLLRKDFIIDTYHLYEARAAGADAALLIAACLDDGLMGELMACADDLGLAALVEVHDTAEMARAERLHARLIGINNRNLATFTTDLAVTERLAADAPEHAALVSESGIFTADDVRRVHRAGADAVLVGEALMRGDDIAASVRNIAQAVIA